MQAFVYGLLSLTASGMPLTYTALLWQKEASDKSPKSEKVMFLDWT